MAIEVKYITTTAAREPEIPVINGQIIAIKDTDQYYYDMGGVRRTTSGQIHVTELPKTGLQNMLYVLNSGSNKGIYAYDGSSFVLLASPNTDVAVTTTPDTTSTKVYLTGTTSSSTATGGLKVDTDIYFDATTGKLTAKGFLGKATSAGTADSATAATNDSKSQNIAATYIKRLSVSGRTITYTKGDGTTGTITTQDTTYSNATQSASGLMSASDKAKVDGIQAGAQVNTVTGVKGNSETAYRTGNINITPTNIGLGNVTNESKATMFTNAALTGTPTAPTAASGTNSTQIASTAFVQAAIDKKIAAADAMIYKGTIGTDGTVTALPATHSTGWTYKVTTAGTYAGVKCEVGDMVICLTDGTAATDSHWTVVQNNIDGAVTGPTSSVANRVAIFSGTSGKAIADSGYTIASSVPANAKFTDTVYTHPSHTAYSSGLYKVTVDALGHVTAATAVTKSDITGLGIPGSDTNTHYAAYLYTGASASATANAAASNGSVYLNLVENGGVRNSHLIKGSGATTVTSDANGVITISSLNTTYAQATSSTLGLVKIGYTASGKNYPVQLNSSGQMYVNVPWTDTNTNTTYSAGTGISLSGTTFSNSGVRSIATGASNGTISVNTGGTTANVAVKGLGSAAYTASTDYATADHSHSGYAGSNYAGGPAKAVLNGGIGAIDGGSTYYPATIGSSYNPVYVNRGTVTSCTEGIFAKIIYFSSFTDLTTKVNAICAAYTGDEQHEVWYPIYTGSTSSSSRTTNLGTLNPSSTNQANYGIVLDFMFSPTIYSQSAGTVQVISAIGLSIRNLKLDHQYTSAHAATSFSAIYLDGVSNGWFSTASYDTMNFYGRSILFENNEIQIKLCIPTCSTACYRYYKCIEIAGNVIFRNNIIDGGEAKLTSSAYAHAPYLYVYGVELSAHYNIFFQNNYVYVYSTSSGYAQAAPLNIKTSASTSNTAAMYRKMVITGNILHGYLVSYVGRYNYYNGSSYSADYSERVISDNIGKIV